MVHPALAVIWSSTLSRQHQPAAGLIPHRPIIDGQKLLADTLGNGVKTCAGAAGEDEAYHEIEIKKRPTTIRNNQIETIREILFEAGRIVL